MKKKNVFDRATTEREIQRILINLICVSKSKVFRRRLRGYQISFNRSFAYRTFLPQLQSSFTGILSFFLNREIYTRVCASHKDNKRETPVFGNKKFNSQVHTPVRTTPSSVAPHDTLGQRDQFHTQLESLLDAISKTIFVKYWSYWLRGDCKNDPSF